MDAIDVDVKGWIEIEKPQLLSDRLLEELLVGHNHTLKPRHLLICWRWRRRKRRKVQRLDLLLAIRGDGIETLREIIKGLDLHHEGQTEGKGRSLSNLTLDGDQIGRIAHVLHQGQRNGETKTRSLKHSCRTRVCLIEGLKDEFLDILFHSNSRIDDLELEGDHLLHFSLFC